MTLKTLEYTTPNMYPNDTCVNIVSVNMDELLADRIDNDIPDRTLNNENTKRVNKIKYLGIIVDDNLDWKGQYKCIKDKLKGGLTTLAKLKNILTQRKLD